jgi:hypothetical protein
VKGEVGIDLLLPDHPDDFLDEHAVFEHQQVRVKNVRLLCAHVATHAALHLGDLLAGLTSACSKRLDLLSDFRGRQTAPGDDVAGTVQDKNLPAANAGGNGDAAIHLFSFGCPDIRVRPEITQARPP